MVYWCISRRKIRRNLRTMKKNIFLFHGAIAPSGPGPPHYQGFTITLIHTTVGRTTLDEWLARHRDLYPATHNHHKRQIFIPRRNSNPQFQQASCSRPTSHTAQPPGWHDINNTIVKPSSVHSQTRKHMAIIYQCTIHITDTSGHADWSVGLWPLDCWNWGF